MEGRIFATTSQPVVTHQNPTTIGASQGRWSMTAPWVLTGSRADFPVEPPAPFTVTDSCRESKHSPQIAEPADSPRARSAHRPLLKS
jgi:hypothetical protein